MNIVVLGPYPISGREQTMSGPMRVVFNLCIALAQAQVTIRVLNISAQKKLGPVDRHQINGVDVWTIPPYDVKTIIKGIRSFNPEIVHIHGILPPFLVPLFLNPKTFEAIYTVHGVVSREKVRFPSNLFATTKIQKYLLSKVTHVVAVSELTRQLVIKDYEIPPNKISVITHGVDKSFFEHVQPLNLSKYNLSLRNKHVLLYVGGIRKVKGLDFLLQSLRYLLRDDWVLLIVGPDSDHLSELKKQFPELFIQQKVFTLGSMNQLELRSAYQVATICILPSRYESYGLVGLEAMASGKPLIVSDRVGMRFLITSGHNGFVVPFGDTQHLAKLIDHLLEHKILRHKIGQNAQLTARQETWQNKATAYLKLYNQLLA